MIMNMGRFIFFSVWLLLTAFVVQAKEPKPSIRFLTVNDGLSSLHTRSVIEDNLGNLWFGGASSAFDFYDGQKVYKWKELHSHNPKYNNVSKTIKRKDGKIWVSYLDKAVLGILDPLTKEVDHIETVPFKDSGKMLHLKSLSLLDFTVDKKEQNIWLLTNKGSLFHIKLDKNKKPIYIEPVDINIKSKQGVFFGYLFIDTKDGLWVSYEQALFYKSAKEINFRQLKSDTEKTVRTIYEDKDNNILIGTNKGILKADSLGVYPVIESESHPLNTVFTMVIHQDHKGHFWIGSSRGLFKVNSISKDAELVNVAPELAGKKIYMITSDSYGGIWFTVHLLGVGYINLYDTPFKNLKQENVTKKQEAVHKVFKDSKNILWVVTDNGLVLRDESSNKEYYYYKAGSDFKKSKRLMPRANIESIYETPSGEIWLCFKNRHLARVKGSDYANLTFEWIDLEAKYRNVTGFEMDKNGYFWISTLGQGIVRYNTNNGVFQTFEGYGIFNKIVDMILDMEKNTLWMATRNKGIQKIVFDSESNIESISNFQKEKNNPHSLSSNNVYHIFQDNKGKVWAMSTDRTLNHLVNEKERQFEKITKRDGIPDEYLRQIQIDKNGNIWMAGVDLYCLNRKGMSVRKFNKKAFNNNIFIQNAMFQDKEGHLYFGGVYGVNSIHPDHVQKSPYHPTIYLSGLQIEGEAVQVGETINDRVLLDKPLEYKESITLFYNEKDITFHVRGIYPPANDDLKYNYKLVGFQKKWLVSSDGTINFGALPDGKYLLRVHTYDNLGHKSNEKEIEIIVLPPWWETTWFRLIALALLIIVPYAIYRRKLVLLRQNKVKLEHMVNERTQEISAQKEEILSQRDQMKEQHYQLQQSYNDIKHLSSFGKELSTVYDTEIVVDTTYESLREFMEVDMFEIGVLKPKNNFLKSYTKKCGKQEVKRLHLQKEKEHIMLRSLDEQKIIHARNKDELGNLKGETNGGNQSVIYLPLMYQNKGLGVLAVHSKKVNAFSERHISILETLGTYLSSTLENIKSYDIIIEKNENIIASIEYAKTIQRALLSSVNTVISYFPENFVFYQPKDIVSGDFYWAYQRGEKLFVAVVDCTGHGVPGALLSVIGVNILNKVIGEMNLESPDEILENINTEIKHLLSQETSRNDDGMDMSICTFERGVTGKMKVSFAGAKSNIQLVRNGSKTCEVIKGTRRSIGGWSTTAKRDFELHTIELNSGDCIYLNSDGYIDQSNIEGKKFGSKRFVGLLEEVASLSMSEQKDAIKQKLGNYMEGKAQRDDMTVLGIRV